MATIEREILFFRVDIGKDSGGKPIPFNPENVCSHINQLPFDNNAPQKRYWEDNNGKVLACWIDSEKMPCKIRLSNIRRDDLPLVEESGQLLPLEISEQSGLAEQTHIVFITEEIVGCDFNFYGPRVTRLPYYFAEKAVGIAPETLNFSPLIRQDISKQLRTFGHLTLFNLRIQSSYIDVLKEVNDSLWDSFKAAQSVGESDDIEIILKASKSSKGWLSDDLRDIIKALLREKDLRYLVKRFKIRGYNLKDNRVIPLDLLSDKLLVMKTILRTDRRTKALNKAAAYNAIINAYTERKDEIQEAASISI